MSEMLNLKEIERKAWRSTFDDGLWDLYLGTLLLLMGMNIFFDTYIENNGARITVYIALMIVSMTGLFVGKRFITMPRIGRAKFGPRREVARKKVILVLFISVALGLLLFALTATFVFGDIAPGWEYLIPLGYAVNMLVVFGAMAYYLQFERLYIIAVLMAIPLPLDFLARDFLGLEIGFWAFSIPGAIIVSMGLVYFVRFIREYPVVKTGE